MKLDRILIILIVNAIFWSLINSVKNNKDKNEMTRVGESSKDNDGAESSVQKSEGTLKGTKMNNKERKREINRIYYQNNKEKIRERKRIYHQNNKEKKREDNRKYYQDNKERINEKKLEYNRKYLENNREKKSEWNRRYREKMENKQASLQSVDPREGNVNSDNNEGTSFANTQNEDLRNKGKFEKDFFNQGEEEGDKDKTETYVDEQNQNVVEDPNKIPESCMNQINLNEYPFDLNEEPEDNDEDVC